MPQRQFGNYAEWEEAAQSIVDAMKEQGIDAMVEYQFIGITLPDGRYIAFGDVNDDWDGQVYAPGDDMSTPLEDGIETDIPTTTFDPQTIASAVKDAIGKLPPFQQVVESRGE